MNEIIRSLYTTLISNRFEYEVDAQRQTLYADFKRMGLRTFLRWQLETEYDEFGCFMLKYCVRYR